MNIDHDQRQARRPVLGGGVSAWLDSDDEHTAWEASELQRRRTEADLTRPCNARAPLPPPFITGSLNGRDIVVCAQCQTDIDHHRDTWCRCDCGRALCKSCYNAGCLCGTAPQPLVTIRLADHLNLDDDQGIDRGLNWPAEHQPLPDPTFAEMQCADTGQNYAVDQATGLTAAVSGSNCWTCLQPLVARGEWRICRCSAAYCWACAAGPCWSCGAAYVFQGTDDPLHDPTDDNMVKGNGDPHEDPFRDGGRDSFILHSDASTDGGSDFAGRDKAIRGALTEPPPLPGSRIAPEEALRRRTSILEERRRAQVEYRINSRRLACQQVAHGRRPRRPKLGKKAVEFITANVTGLGPLKDELLYGTALNAADYILIQEHKQFGEAKEQAADWMMKQGWDCICGEAYFKASAYGGGTAVATRLDTGIRPLPIPPGICDGRFSAGVADYGGDIIVGSIYGLSGLSLSQQLALWAVIVSFLRTLGLPFVIGGDWQVSPAEAEATGILRTLRPPAAQTKPRICWRAPRLTGSLYRSAWWEIRGQPKPCTAPLLRPMLPSGWPSARRRELLLRLDAWPPPSPSLFCPPPGPMKFTAAIDWDFSPTIARACDNDNPTEEELHLALRCWYAGFEFEIGNIVDVIGSEDEAKHLGVGEPPRTVLHQGRGRFRTAPGGLGVLGQRTGWLLKALHLLRLHAPAIADGHGSRHIKADIICRVGHRATAFLRAGDKVLGSDDEFPVLKPLIHRALRFVASTVRTSHGDPPLLAQWANGNISPSVAKCDVLYAELQDAHHRLTVARRRRQAEAAKRWAKLAALGELHRATRATEAQHRKTASARKDHPGERTDFQAAVHGAKEWGTQWEATHSDTSADIMEAVEAMTSIRACHPEIPLPPIDDLAALHQSKRFKGGTGLSTDAMRPWHVAKTSKGARRALAGILMAIERRMRWPEALRVVVSVAIGKRAGGARLIGISTAIYRLWARIRYFDCRRILEERIARPFFAAAPHRGAERAAFEASLDAETASARGLVSATSSVDMKKFYENIAVTDFAKGALEQGIPFVVVVLTAHLYTGPRVIRVRRAAAPAVYPRKSIVAGCTWATVHVRVMMVSPLDRLITMIKDMARAWETVCRVSFYIDDGVLMTMGRIDAVTFVHQWATRLLIRFITQGLRKPIAEDKLMCVASSSILRRALNRALRDEGFDISAEGEILGVDFAPGRGGGRGKRQLGRFAKAFKRRRKLAWLRKLQGDARQVARGGIGASNLYGSSSTGLRPRRMYQLRRIHGSVVRVRCGGSSLTCRLAIGGSNYEDFDPQVLTPNPPP